MRSKNKWLILLGSCIMIFLVNVDTTVVNLAIPTLNYYFHADLNETQWMLTAYLSATALSFIASSQLCDIFGRKNIQN